MIDKNKMINVDKFLADFAEKFGKDDKEKEIIKSCDKFIIDYADGVFTLWNEDSGMYHIGKPLCYMGGSNGSIFKDEDYRFLWDNIISKHEEFMKWMKKHNFTEKDLMTLQGNLVSVGPSNERYQWVEIQCGFGFYDKQGIKG